VLLVQEQQVTQQEAGDGTREDIKEARTALSLLADEQQVRQEDSGGGIRQQWRASGGLNSLFQRFAAVLVKFLLRMARILRWLSDERTSSNPFSLDAFVHDACFLAHKSLLDLLIVKHELEQLDEEIQHYPLGVTCPLDTPRRVFHRLANDFAPQYGAEK